MSSPASTAPQVKAYLVAQIKASPDLPAQLLGQPPLISYGVPGEYQPACIVAVGTRVIQTAVPSQMVGSGGAGWLRENYHLEVVVSAFAGGDTPQVVDEAALQLWQVVAAVIRADPSLGGLVIQASPSGFEAISEWTEDHKGRLCQLTGEVEVHAQL